MVQEAPLVVLPLPEPEETPEDGERPEDDELLDELDPAELDPEEDEPEDLPEDDVPEDEDLADDEVPELAFLPVAAEDPVPACAVVAAAAWVAWAAPTTAAVAVAAVAASAVVQVIFLTRRRPAVLAWMACRKWELVMATGKPARF